MFEMRGIHKRFDAVVALKDASLRVSPGEIRALLGSNGSGKSTMIKVLAGLYYPNSGEILFNGEKVDIHSGFDARKLGVATAYQDLSLVPTMSVIDNILLGNEPMAKLGMVNRKLAVDSVLALLKRFKIDCDPDDYVQTLMPSTQSMLEVAKAVSLKPRLLLLDEVTASLHHDEIDVLFGILREMKAEGVAIVYVTHRMKEIFEVCDNATIMRSGETVAEGSLKDMTLDDIVFYMTGQRPDAAESAPLEEADYDKRELVLSAEHVVLLPKVKDLSLKAYKGEIVGIGGLEGQGQPEFIRTLLGLVPHQGGEIRYLNKSVKFRSPAEAIKNGMGFISGERNREAIFVTRSVEENIFAAKAAKGNMFAYVTASAMRKFAQNAVKTYNVMVGSLKHPASSLSGGNQQKLVVARWLALKPELLLLDDPTKGVDVHSRREIQKILRQCAQEGMTVIISSSENEELIELADRIYVFYEGKVSAMLSGTDKTPEKLVAAMMGLTQKNMGGESA